jgi:hypothetical protein
MTHTEQQVHAHANGDIEQFATDTVNVAAALPSDIPELPAAQIALSFVGVGPTMPTRMKLYGTYISVNVAEQLAHGILEAVAEARASTAPPPAAATERDLVAATPEQMRAMIEQNRQVEQLRHGPAGR